MSSIIPKSICRTRGSVADFEQSSTTLRTYFVRDCSESGDSGVGAETLAQSSNATGSDGTLQLDAPAAISTAVATATNQPGQSNQHMTLPGFSTFDSFTELGGGHAATPCVRGQNPGFPPSSGVYGDSTTISQVQAPALRHVEDGQITQYPWRAYTSPDWAQETEAPNATSSSVLDSHFDQLGQIGMPTATSSMGAGAFWDDATWYNDLSMT